MKANEILAIGNEIISTNSRKSLYKSELFADCKTDKEKKNLRMKLRKKLDSFIAESITSAKKPKKLEELRKAWQSYATQVYVNATEIVDANANTEKKKSITDFLTLMQPAKGGK